jgi:hypothetical protein
MTLEELEFELPLTIQIRERKKMPCEDCEKECFEYVNYEQRIYRNDDYSFHNKKKRTYGISYFRKYSDVPLVQTNRYHTFQEALIEAHKMLDKLGVEK